MKSFLKFIGAIASIFALFVALISVSDKFLKKDYYICDPSDDEN